MEFRRIWTLRGANFWASLPVIEAEVVLGEHDGCRPAQLPALLHALQQYLPDWQATLDNSATLADLLQQVVITLQQQVGSEATFGLVQKTAEAGFYRVIFAYDEEALGRAALEIGRDLILAALRDEAFDLPAKLAELRNLAHQVRLGPSTGAIVRAAQRRGIPTCRLNEGSLVQLGLGCKQQRIWTAETDATAVLGEVVAQDKQRTRALLQAIGVPIPEGRPVSDAEDAWRATTELGPPVVVKPQFGNQGRGVATNLSTREQVLAAFEAARQEGSSIVVEKFVPGVDHRVLVVGERVIAAALREPAHVIGDGQSTINQLIEVVNRDPRRSDGHATVLSHIKIDAVAQGVLTEQGYTPESVPAAGTRVLIRRNANLSTGGTAADVTDQVHPRVALRAVDAARAVGLDIAGVDIVVTDIGKPLEEQNGAIVEVNAGPGLRMHLEPSAGKSRPVGEAIVDNLFPPDQTGRIPIVAVTGVNGKTTTTRLIAHVLLQAGRYVGMTCTDGIYLNGRRTETRDCSGPQSARTVLMNRLVAAAVLETARGGILREGLGFDQCDVAVVTNLGRGDHLGLRGIETLDELARVKSTLVKSVAATGTAVLNAADPLVAAMAPHAKGLVTFFAPTVDHPLLSAHARNGGRSASVRAGSIVLGAGPDHEVLLPLAEVPLTHAGQVAFQVENVLAAAAALWALAVPLDVIRAGLRTFTGNAAQAPGRFNVFERGDRTVIVDYAHNPSAVAALVTALESFPQRRRSLVFSGCNRREVDLLEMGAAIGHGFDRVILYQDWGHSGRHDGELNAFLRQGLNAGPRTTEIVEVPTELEAIRLALDGPADDELIVLGVDSIDEALKLVSGS